MTVPTERQFHTAKRLVVSTDELTRRVLELTRLLKFSETALEERVHKFNVETNYNARPERLAGAIPLARRQSRDAAAIIEHKYHWLLQCLHKNPESGVAPTQVNYADLPPAAKPYLLAPYLGLLIGNAYPRLCFKSSRVPEGPLVYVSTGGPADPLQWRRHISTINGWLGGHWVLSESTSNTITLTRQEPLPKIIHYKPSMLRKGAVFLGFDADTQQPVHIPISDLSSGMYIPGTAGSGKSNSLHILTQSLFHNLHLFSGIYLIDGKDGVAVERYRHVAPGKVHVLYDEPDLWDLTAQLVNTMKRRNVAQRDAGIDKATSNFIAVVIDEMATYTAKPTSDNKSDENKRHAAFLENLAKLAGRGRSTGLRLFITSQRPVDSQIPMTVRANCQSLLCFRLNNATDAGIAMGDDDNDPRALSKGHAFYRDDEGITRRVQFPLAPPQAKRGPK